MIEGIPDGWGLVGIGSPIVGVDWVVNRDGTAVLCEVEHYAKNWPIIRKIEKPKQFRPCQNMAEAMPFWDAKLTPKNKGLGVLRVFAMGDNNVGIGFTLYTYQEAFEKYECDDGIPFGVEVQS